MSVATPETKSLSLRQVFARNIRLARIHVGVSQEKLAAEAGLDRAFVGTLERGQRNISIDNVELIAVALGIPAHELLDPQLPQERGFDLSTVRSPRTTRLYPADRSKLPVKVVKPAKPAKPATSR
jgi:transcriptional regulator with XRE-family HTH domain